MISRSFHFRRLRQSPCSKIVQKLSLECRSDAAGTEVSAASQAKGWRAFSLAFFGPSRWPCFSLGPLFLVLLVVFFLVLFLVVFFLVRILGIDRFKHG
jgi:hypothetical protein